MALLYQVDLTAQASQTVLDAGGAYVIDGLTWYAKGDPSQGAQTYTRNLVNGSGLAIAHTGGGNSTPIGTNSSLNNPHWFLPLAQIPGWDASQALLVRARFLKSTGVAEGAALIGFCDSTDDAVGLTAGQRAKDRFVGAEADAGTTALFRYKNSTAAATTTTGRAGTIANNECIPGVYMLNERFALAGSEHLASGMPTVITSWLPGSGNAAADISSAASNPGIFWGVDANGTGLFTWYLQNLRIDVIGELADENAPDVTLISPAELTNLRRFQPIVIDVTDTNLDFHQLGFIYDDLGIYEVAYDSADPTLATPYVVTRSTISGGFRYTVYRRSGWPSRPRYRVRATDGNVS